MRKEGIQNKPVNKILSQYMYDIGFIEKYGSGIVMVRNLLKENGNKDLKYILQEIETKAIVYSQISELKESQRLGEKLGENQKKILEIINKNKFISIIELSKELEISTTAIEKNLSKLKQKNLLKRIGPAKGGYWEIVKKEVNKET